MRVEEAGARHLVCNPLNEAARVQVRALLRLRQTLDDFLRPDDPAEAKPGRQRFGKRAHVEHVAAIGSRGRTATLGVQREERRKVLAFIPQLPVRIVFEDRHAVRRRPE